MSGDKARDQVIHVAYSLLVIFLRMLSILHTTTFDIM